MLDKGKERMAENAGAVVTEKGNEETMAENAGAVVTEKGNGETTVSPNFERWVDSIKLMLYSTVEHQTVKACSISIVPEHIRKLKVEAYMPKVVSIGPLHRRTRTDLVYMEEIKWRCMWYLFHRTKDHGTEYFAESVKICSGVLFDLDELVRASYNAGDIKFDSYDLAKIMLLDGCFLLELLISNDKDLNAEFKCHLNTDSPGSEAGIRENVLADLTVLENQIPLFILNELFIALFPNEDEGRIKNLALSLLGYDPGSSVNSSYRSVPNAHHFLELVHSFIIGSWTLGNEEDERKSQTTQGNEHWAVNMEREEPTQGNKQGAIPESEVEETAQGNKEGAVPKKERKKETIHEKVKLRRCATRLEAAGVTIKPPNAEINPAPAEIRFDLDIKFSESSRELTIPPLHITETTEVKWRNFIVWELNRSDRARFIDEDGGTRVICKFIWYALFFQGLICSIHDIQLLRDKKVIVVHDAKGSKQGDKKKTMNNEDLLNLFHEITEGVDDFQIDMDPGFYRLFQKLNKYQSADRATQACRVTWHFCRCVLTGTWFKSRNAYRALRREYIPTGWKLVAVLAAVVALGLTAAQTGLAIRFH